MIGKAEHTRFIQRMELHASSEQQELIQDDLDHLRQLYRDYHSMLYQLRHLAEEYEATRQNIKMKLRHQHQASRQNE